MTTDHIRQHCLSLSQKTWSHLNNQESASLNFSGEQMSYVRLNNSKVRQSTDVTMATARLVVYCDRRTHYFNWDLSFNIDQDLKTAQTFIEVARAERPQLEVNPEATDFESNPEHMSVDSDFTAPGLAPLLEFLSSQKLDLAGLLASGKFWRSSFNSKGQTQWFESASSFLDYSIYTTGPTGEPKALKNAYFAKHWDQSAFELQVQQTKNQLEYFTKPNQTIKPGNYRAYLSPFAVAEILGTMSWGAFSYAFYKKGLSPLGRLANGEAKFSNKLNMRENFDLNLTPRFNSRGEIAAKHLDLICKGELKNYLISSNSAQEYKVTSNLAEPSFEAPRSLEVLPGELLEQNILTELDTGLYLGNLHYCNWSDRPSARITGMTRFGCFWVEKGKIQAPIADFRFDVSLYQIFGPEGLLALTQKQELIPHLDTYHMRATGGLATPGALIKEFACVL